MYECYLVWLSVAVLFSFLFFWVGDGVGLVFACEVGVKQSDQVIRL